LGPELWAAPGLGLTGLGTIAELAAASTDKPFSVGDVAFYIGLAAVCLYLGLLVAGVGVGLLGELASRLGLSTPGVESALENLALVAWAGITLFLVVRLFTDPTTQPDDSGASTFLRVLGIASVVVMLVIWNRTKPKAQPSA
jgi:hypothetical protein